MLKNVLMVSLVVAGSGCATTGIGAGEEEIAGLPGEAVGFEYTAKDRHSGTLIAVTESGEQFRGTYVQLADAPDHLEPAVEADRAWTGYVVTSTPRGQENFEPDLIAELHGDRGHTMRCHLDLTDDKRGLDGGARGKCVLNDGQNVETVFPPRVEPVAELARDSVK
ncbi:MAG: hypothetical protein QM817_03495 [Archangium sp.]